jgi:hypothetical protein
MRMALRKPANWGTRSGIVAALTSVLAVAPASACSLAPVAAQSPAASRPGDAPAINGVCAYLFQNKKGGWSEDALAPEYGGSWNSIAGPNAANATLVVVEVSGAPGRAYASFASSETKYAVRLVAREGRRKLLLDQTQTIPVLNDDGRVSLAFLLHQGGCVRVELTASIVGPRAPPSVQRSLNFACGE